MKMTFKAFAKKLFGAKYERLARTLFLYALIFWGLHAAGWKIEIAPFIRLLTVSVFTAGVMGQALSSEDQAAYMQHMLMVPFERQKFVLSYVAALGAYAILTKTAALLAIVLAVSRQTPLEALECAVCAVHAVLTAAAVFSLKKRWRAGVPWAAAVLAVLFLFGNDAWVIAPLTGSGICAVVLLLRADGYAFYRQKRPKRPAPGGHSRHSMGRYFFRYLSCHKNYLANTAVLWGFALVLPFFFRQLDIPAAAPVGFAILTLNTPIGILLSCDPALAQAVRFLPGQKKAFFAPYCLFIFLCNITADIIFLCGLQIQNGGVTIMTIGAALFFALQSAVLSVLLEWRRPIRNWKIESDLWHHPRKYIVPACMLLLAGIVGTWPAVTPALLLLLAAEIAALCAAGRY